MVIIGPLGSRAVPGFAGTAGPIVGTAGGAGNAAGHDIRTVHKI
jgi:hypothetical protein